MTYRIYIWHNLTPPFTSYTFNPTIIKLSRYPSVDQVVKGGVQVALSISPTPLYYQMHECTIDDDYTAFMDLNSLLSLSIEKYFGGTVTLSYVVRSSNREPPPYRVAHPYPMRRGPLETVDNVELRW